MSRIPMRRTERGFVVFAEGHGVKIWESSLAGQGPRAWIDAPTMGIDELADIQDAKHILEVFRTVTIGLERFIDLAEAGLLTETI